MSFVPENIPESPRIAPEKYGMYDSIQVKFGPLTWGQILNWANWFTYKVIPIKTGE